MLLSSGSHTRSISIHAPAGGATNHPDGERQEADFNSRPCGRGDTKRSPGLHRRQAISIHAPAGGATKDVLNGWKMMVISIHAPAGGATRPDWQNDQTSDNFNSRPCGRGDFTAR